MSVQFLIKGENGKPDVIGIGLLPFNVEQIKAGRPSCPFRKLHESLPDYLLTISTNMHTRPKDKSREKHHISLNFTSASWSSFLKRKWARVPLSRCVPFDKSCPNIDILIFTANSPEEFWTEMQKQGISAKEYRDDRPAN